MDRKMGRKNDSANSTSLVDQYRKQLGRQEKKVVSDRRKEMKRLKSEQATVSYWKVSMGQDLGFGDGFAVSY
jgi:hypothetical protein